MNSKNSDKFRSINHNPNFIISNFQNIKDFNITITNDRRIQFFFEYLRLNKLNFQILECKSNLFLSLKILTLVPKIFMIILNNKDIRNLSIDYKDLRAVQKKWKLSKENIENFYVIFLDSSIKSYKDVIINSKFIAFNKIPLNLEYKRIINTKIKIEIKNKLREGLPLGKYHKNNRLNDLTGKEWIKFTKSWFIHNPPPRNKVEILHPAKFPESLIERFIRFFTKERQLILDPFIGTGSTVLASRNTLRSCIGVEINRKYVKIAKSRLTQKTLGKYVDINKKPLIYEIFNADSNNLEIIWEKENLPLVDFCITSPPYWNQLKRDFIRQKKRKNIGLDTVYSENPKDISNIDDYKEFLTVQKKIFDHVHKILKNNCYLVIITNNLFYDGKMYPLAFDTAISLSDKWVLKDEQIWCQDNKQLVALGVNYAYVGNRHHIYCLIFRKEEI